MRQKYIISKSNEKNEVSVQELGELMDKDFFSLLCEEIYNADAIASAVKKGKENLVSVLRTKNMYPPDSYAQKIAEAVIELYNPGYNNLPVEVMFDDRETLSREYEPYDIEEELIGEPIEVDDLLIDETDEKYEDQHELDNISTSGIKLAEDEMLDSEEDF